MKIESIGMQNMEERQTRPRIYFFHDENVMENFVNRHNRPYKVYRELFPEIEKRLKLQGHINAGWSKYAGCTMCPCSPGFIVKNSNDIGLYDDLFITLTFRSNDYGRNAL